MNEELKVIITADTKKLTDGCKAAVDELKKLANCNDDTQKSFDQLEDTIAKQQQVLDYLKRQYANLISTQGSESQEAKELESKIKNLNTSLNNNKSRLSEIQAETDKLTEAHEKLGNAYEELEKTVSDNESKLAKLRKEYANVVLEQGESSDAAKDLKKEIIKLDSSLDSHKRKLKAAEDAANKISFQQKDLKDNYDLLTDEISSQENEIAELTRQYKNLLATHGKETKESKELKKTVQHLNGELDKSKKSLDKVENATKGLASKQSQLSDKFEKFKGKLSLVQGEFQKYANVAKTALKATAGAIVAVTTALVANVGATAEYRENQAKLATSFKETGKSAETAKNTYNDLYRVLGDDGQATEAAAHLGQLVATQSDLAEWTEICTGVYATFGDSLPIESLTEAVNETVKTGEVTGALSDALNWAGISEEEFQGKLAECNSEVEREQLLRETLNGLYADAAGQYEKQNEAVLAQHEAQQQLNDTLAVLGETFAPIQTALTTFLNDVLLQIQPIIEDFVNEHGDELEQILSNIADAIGKVLQFIFDNWEMVCQIAGIILGISAALVVINGVMAITNAIAAASPITWIVLGIVAAIAALVAIIALVITHWDELKATIKKFCDDTKKKFSEWWQKIKEYFSNLAQSIKDKLNSAKEWAIEKFTSMKDGIIEKVTNLKEKVTGFFDSIKQNMKDKIESAKTSVLGIFDKIKSGITEKITGAKNKVKEMIDKIKSIFDFKWEFPKLKLPHFSIEGEFSLNPPSIPHLGVDWYARGGVFDKPTLFNNNGRLSGLGENGAEAVVPLENNTQWLDKIANKLAGKASSRPIILTIDGKTFAQTSIDSINQLTKQTGHLGLKLGGC